MLIKNDIMSLEGFVIDVKVKKMLIKSSEMTTPINVRQKEQFLTKTLLAS